MKCGKCGTKNNTKFYLIHPVSRYGCITLCDKCHEQAKVNGIPCRVNEVETHE
jgi:hypothetical protein